MASGVIVSEQCKNIFDDFMRLKNGRYLIFYIQNGAQIEVETMGDRSSNYDHFLADIERVGPHDCRYALFDFEYWSDSEMRHKNKHFLMTWCPETATIKNKMLYSSSFEALKKSMDGRVLKFIQATDLAEASKEVVEDKVREKDKLKAVENVA